MKFLAVAESDFYGEAALLRGVAILHTRSVFHKINFDVNGYPVENVHPQSHLTVKQFRKILDLSQAFGR